jgi:hypothetical protein
VLGRRDSHPCGRHNRDPAEARSPSLSSRRTTHSRPNQRAGECAACRSSRDGDSGHPTAAATKIKHLAGRYSHGLTQLPARRPSRVWTTQACAVPPLIEGAVTAGAVSRGRCSRNHGSRRQILALSIASDMDDFQVAPHPAGDMCLSRHPRRDRRETHNGLGRCRLIRTMDGPLSTGLFWGNRLARTLAR